MFGKTLTGLIRLNCTGCIHKNVCQPVYRLNLEKGECRHRLESESVYHQIYNIRLKVGETAYIIDGDFLNMRAKPARVNEIEIRKNNFIFYMIEDSERKYILGKTIFKDERSCLDYINFLKIEEDS